MDKQEKNRELSVMRFHKAKWEKAKSSWLKLNNTDKVKESEEKINFYENEIIKLNSQ